MAQETDTVIVKLDPEQLAEIKKNYLDTIERVIQERKEIKEKLGLALSYITEAFGIFSKLHPESVICPDTQTEAGIISGSLLEAIQFVKQVHDSIHIEANDEPA